MRIKAIWMFDHEEINQIHHTSSNPEGCWVAIDESETYWFGAWNNAIAPYKVGDDINVPKYTTTLITTPSPIEMWESIRQYIFVDQKAGAPCKGVSVKYSGNGHQRSKGNRCECGADTCSSPMHSDWCPRYTNFT